jgi:poly-D-alanine transfer protein DltD
MKNVVLWDVAQSAVTCPRWFTARGFSTLKMEAIYSSETSVDARSTQRHIPEDDNLHSHRCESLKSYLFKLYLADMSNSSVSKETTEK